MICHKYNHLILFFHFTFVSLQDCQVRLGLTCPPWLHVTDHFLSFTPSFNFLYSFIVCVWSFYIPEFPQFFFPYIILYEFVFSLLPTFLVRLLPPFVSWISSSSLFVSMFWPFPFISPPQFFPSSLSSSLPPQGSDKWLDATWVFFGPYPRRWCRSRSGFRSTRGWACCAASWCEVYWPGKRGRKREQVAELIIPQCLTSFVCVTSGGSPRWSLSCRWMLPDFCKQAGEKKKNAQSRPAWWKFVDILTSGAEHRQKNKNIKKTHKKKNNSPPHTEHSMDRTK